MSTNIVLTNNNYDDYLGSEFNAKVESTVFESHTGDTTVHHTIAEINEQDKYVSGGTYSAGNINFGGHNISFDVDVSALLDDTNTFVTGATLDGTTYTLTRNDGVEIGTDFSAIAGGDYPSTSTFNSHTGDTTVHHTLTELDGIYLKQTDYIDVYVTGGTLDGTNYTITRNDGIEITTDFASIAGGGPDTYVTGGTLTGYVAGIPILTLTRNDGAEIATDLSNMFYSPADNIHIGLAAGANFGASAGSNVAIGSSALETNVTQDANTAVGIAALQYARDGGNNTAIGYCAGRYYGANIQNYGSSNSIFIGDNTKAFGNAQGNEIVIGSGAVGDGSNKIVLGNSSHTNAKIYGKLYPTAGLYGGGSAKMTIDSAIGLDIIGNTTIAGTTYMSGDATIDGTVTIRDNAMTGTTLLSISGASGTLFSVYDDVYGDLLTVYDSDENPIFNVDADTVTLNTANIDLDDTTFTNQKGVIMKDGVPFIHNFNYGDNGTVTTSGFNTFIGYTAGNFEMGSDANQTYHASKNIGIGISPLKNNTTGYNNLAIGISPLTSNTTGFSNIAIGQNSMYANTTGQYNTAIGYNSLRYTLSGLYNVAIGRDCLFYHPSASYNIGIGYRAVQGESVNYSANTAHNNIGIGNEAVKLVSTGVYNVGVGYKALNTDSTGGYNVGIGKDSLLSVTTGSYNIGIGNQAAANVTTGGYNIFLGADTDASADGVQYENVIGAGAIGAGSNTTTIGNTSQTLCKINGAVQVGQSSATASAALVGAIRYRVSGNNSYCEMVMQTAASTYAWVVIKQNTW